MHRRKRQFQTAIYISNFVDIKIRKISTNGANLELIDT